MAFAPRQLVMLSGAASVRLFHYTTPDSIKDVEKAGYFPDIAAINVGNIIYIYDSTADVTVQLVKSKGGDLVPLGLPVNKPVKRKAATKKEPTK